MAIVAKQITAEPITAKIITASQVGSDLHKYSLLLDGLPLTIDGSVLTLSSLVE